MAQLNFIRATFFRSLTYIKLPNTQEILKKIVQISIDVVLHIKFFQISPFILLNKKKQWYHFAVIKQYICALNKSTMKLSIKLIFAVSMPDSPYITCHIYS